MKAALGRDPTHFAYPFGTRGSFGPQQPLLAAEAGFASAVTALPGVVWPKDRSNLQALPRIGWNGRSLRILRVLLTGMAVE
jgi:peptidoglycan/xylan/chitin deacetylase (PgdA/CDA1 family)